MIVRHKPCLVLTLLLFLFGASAGAAHAKQGAWISPAKTIAGTGKQSLESAQVAVDDDRTAIAVWLLNDPGQSPEYEDDTSLVMAAIRPPNGKFGRPFALTGKEHQLSNLKLVSGRGSTTVLWQRSGDGSIYARTRPSGGKFEPADQLADNALGEISLAMGRDGTTAVAWIQSRPMQPDVVQVSVRPWGSQFSEPIDLPSGPSSWASDPAIAVDHLSQITVAWRGDGIFVFDLPTDGSPEPPRKLTGSDQGYHPEVGIGPGGSTTVAWVRSTGSGRSLYTSTRPAEGEFPPPVRRAQSASLEGFDMAVAGDGRVTLLWYFNNREGDPDYGYFDFSYTRMVSWAPGSDPVTKRLGRVWGSDQGGGSLAGSVDGSTTLVWSNSFGRDSVGLMSSTWTPEGTLTEPVLIDDDQPWSTSLAAGPDGNVVAVWGSFTSDGTLIRTASTVPAYCGRSSMKLGRVIRSSRSGTARVTVNLGSRGKVSTLASPWITPTTTRASKAGRYTVRIVPRGPARRLLGRTGWAEVKVGFRFDPAAVPCQNVVLGKEVVLIRKRR